MAFVFNGIQSGLLLLIYELKNLIVAAVPPMLGGYAGYPLAQTIDLLSSAILFPWLTLSILGTIAALGKQYWITRRNNGEDIEYCEPNHYRQSQPYLGKQINRFIESLSEPKQSNMGK